MYGSTFERELVYFRLPQFYRASRLTTKRVRAVLTCISYRYDLRIGLELTKTSAQLKLP